MTTTETLVGTDSNGITWYRRADGTCRLEGGPNVPAPAPVTPLGRLSAAVRRLHADGWAWSWVHGWYRRDDLALTISVEDEVTIEVGRVVGHFPPLTLVVEVTVRPPVEDATWSALLALIGSLR